MTKFHDYRTENVPSRTYTKQEIDDRLCMTHEGWWLIDWMVFYATFNSISVISRQQLTLFMPSWVSPVLGWALKCLAQGQSHEKTQMIQCGSNPGPLHYESNTPPLGHAGPYEGWWIQLFMLMWAQKWSKSSEKYSSTVYITFNFEFLNLNIANKPTILNSLYCQVPDTQLGCLGAFRMQYSFFKSQFLII